MRVAAALVMGCIVALSAISPAAAAEPAFHLEQVLAGYRKPLYVAAHSNPNLLYVVEQRGVIGVAQRDNASAPWVRTGTFLDMRSLVAGPLIGRGLLGMAFDPAYSENGLFYVFYTRKHSDPALNGDIVIAEYRRITDFAAKPRSRRPVLVLDHTSTFHFGGWLGFGPDGYLYLTTGHPVGAPLSLPQDTNSRLGKLLRMNPHAKRGKVAQIPADNPFVGVNGDDLVWTYGLRNPWRASFDRSTGDLWLPDVGSDHWEEINRFAPGESSKGANLGWAMCEGTHQYPQPEEGATACTAVETTPPVIEYGHADGRCSVTGGYVYRGTVQTALIGRYFFADYCTGEIWSVPAEHQSTDALGDPIDTDLRITSFGEDAEGELYVTAVGGTVWRVVQD